MWFFCQRTRDNRFAIIIIKYLCVKTSQINRLSYENELNVALLTSIYAMYVVKKKKFLTLFII